MNKTVRRSGYGLLLPTSFVMFDVVDVELNLLFENVVKQVGLSNGSGVVVFVFTHARTHEWLIAYTDTHTHVLHTPHTHTPHTHTPHTHHTHTFSLWCFQPPLWHRHWHWPDTKTTRFHTTIVIQERSRTLVFVNPSPPFIPKRRGRSKSKQVKQIFKR